MDEHRNQYVFWTKSTGPEPGEPYTCIDYGATREPGGRVRLVKLAPAALDVVLTTIAAKKAAREAGSNPGSNRGENRRTLGRQKNAGPDQTER